MCSEVILLCVCVCVYKGVCSEVIVLWLGWGGVYVYLRPVLRGCVCVCVFVFVCVCAAEVLTLMIQQWK